MAPSHSSSPGSGLALVCVGWLVSGCTGDGVALRRGPLPDQETRHDPVHLEFDPQPSDEGLDPELLDDLAMARFIALTGEDGLIVAAHGAAGVGFLVQASRDGVWEDLGIVYGDSVWVGDPVDAGTTLRARQTDAVQSVTFTPQTLDMSWSFPDSTPETFFEGDTIETRLDISTLPPAGLGGASLRVSLRVGDLTLYLPDACEASGCWTEERSPWAEAPDLSFFSEAYDVNLQIPEIAAGAGRLRVELVVIAAGERVVIETLERELVLLGGRWRWGDLHAHSRWSNDGCEDPEAFCGPRGDSPGEDFFANAEDVELDFAAITDHAEWDWYWPDGAEGDAIPVWDGEAGTAAAALSDAVLPILGYEWSHGSDAVEGDHRLGSHRTVLLSDPSACEDYRVGGLYASEDWTPELGEWYFTSDNANLATSVSALWEALDAADTSCGSDLRWITFAHHSAYEVPQVTDWTLSENQPDRETLIEVFSEHGNSECMDTSVDGCAFGLNSRQTHYPDGSVQAALDQGFQLGFVGGTDGHDGRPGSLEDGPGTVAWWRDADGDGVDDTPTQQYTSGGITGVLVAGSLSTDALFDALQARRTLATTGPRPLARVYARGVSSAIYALGASLPYTDGPFEIVFALEDREDERTGAMFYQLDRIGPGGELIESSSETRVSWAWSPAAGEWTYLRMRYALSDGTEARVWLSPFFAE